jgi:hypothetical protein
VDECTPLEDGERYCRICLEALSLADLYSDVHLATALG